MKISYISSLCVRNDAISNALRDEMGFLMRGGYDDIRLFAPVCDHPELPFTQAGDVRDVAFHPHFMRSDLVVFHFGIYYPLFDLFPVVPPRARKVVVFHNISPASVVAPKDRWLIDRSFAQLDNVQWADHVICDSQTNLSVLRSRGLNVPASVVPLAVHSDIHTPENKPSFSDGVSRIAFVGRFTPAKGPLDLLECAEAICLAEPDRSIQLDFVGNLAFSDADTVYNMRRTAASLMDRFPGKLKIAIHGNAPEDVKHAILRNADLFVLPTRHEGFCVPIIEAISSGCRVVTYDNSNTPDVTGPLGTLVATGDVEELTRAVLLEMRGTQSPDWAEPGPKSYANFVARAKQHLKKFSPARVESIFLQTISRVTAR